MRKLPPLAAIRAFEAAARHENYTRAGEELGLTQAGVSYQIKSLEQRVGAPLFLRNGRKMELSPAGAALAPRISQAFAAMENAFGALSEDQEAVLTLSCSQTLATKFLAPRLGNFQLTHPEIALRMDVSNRVVDLEAGEADVAIRLSQSAPERLASHFMMRIAIAPFASPEYAAQHPELCRPDDPIAPQHRISPDEIWWRTWDAALCTKAQMNAPRGRLQFDSQLLDTEAAMTGNGVAILMPSMFQAELADGRLVRLGRRAVWPDSIFRLVYPEVRRHSHKVRAFRDWLSRELGAYLADDPDSVLDQE